MWWGGVGRGAIGGTYSECSEDKSGRSGDVGCSVDGERGRRGGNVGGGLLATHVECSLSGVESGIHECCWPPH